MIPIKHGEPFIGLMPYTRLMQSERGWHGFLGENWRAYMIEHRDPEDPFRHAYKILEGPRENGKLYERFRLREIINQDTGEVALVGLTGTGFLIGLKQVPGLRGDWCLYHCMLIPFKWRNL